MPTVLPYGTWPSPIDADDLAREGRGYEDLAVAGAAVLFTRPDPATGAMRLHRWSAGSSTTALADELDVRSRVHEYGAGALMVVGDTTLVVHFPDQRLYRVDDDGGAVAVTPDTGATVRFAAGAPVDDTTIVVVRETHDRGRVRNELVLLDVEDGRQHVLVGDRDFVAAARVGVGGWIAWLAWDHPDMPWDGAAAHVGRLVDGGLQDVARVAGGDDVAVADLDWLPDGSLVFSSDETGFWELYRRAPDGTVEPLTSRGVDHGGPRWQLGHDDLAIVGDTVVVVATEEAVDQLGIVADDGSWTELPGPAVAIADVVAHGDGVVAHELDADGRHVIRRHGLDGSILTVDELPPVGDRPGDLATPIPLAVDVEDQQVHAFFHPPANADVLGPPDGAPPLLVFLHGGPTAHTPAARSSRIAWWTTRGFAVADVNYRGSTGYGRDYRRLMRGRWGEIEVADVIAVATELAARGWVDGDRMAIRGGSAGGFTTLAALTQPGQPFCCGTSFYGVADLAALAEHTHKFESRYLDRMVGPLPEARAVYDERSPLLRLEQLSVPVLVMQGLDDEVVPPAQAEAIVAAAAARGLPHAYLAFEGEGHGFRRAENVAAAHEAELAFYGEVMGFTPAGDLPPVLARPPEAAE